MTSKSPFQNKKGKKRTKKQTFESLPVDLLGLVFSFWSIQELHSVGFLLCRTILYSLNEKRNLIAISFYTAWETQLKPLQLYGSVLHTVSLSPLSDTLIEVLQTSKTLTRLDVALCALKKKNFFELPYLRELSVLRCFHEEDHSIGDFLCPQLIKLTYGGHAKANDPSFPKNCQTLSRQLEKLTLSIKEAKRWFPDTKSSDKWLKLQCLTISDNFTVDVHFINFLPYQAPLTELELDLSVATETDLKKLKVFPLKRLFTHSFPLETKNFQILLSSISGITELGLTGLRSSNLKCLETLTSLQALNLRFDENTFRVGNSSIHLDNLNLNSLLIVDLNLSEITVHIKKVDCLKIYGAKKLAKLPFCNGAINIKICAALELDLRKKEENFFQLRNLKLLSVRECRISLSKEVIQVLKECSQLFCLSFSSNIYSFEDEEQTKCQMKLICKKLGIFLSWT